MVAWQLPAELAAWILALSGPLHGRLAWRLLPLLRGVLFAQGRRTVASWLRAAALGQDFRQYYYFLGSLGPRAGVIAAVLLRLVVGVVDPGLDGDDMGHSVPFLLRWALIACDGNEPRASGVNGERTHENSLRAD